jgi:3-oxoacyl-[acyl-carrier-protein] synthase-3
VIARTAGDVRVGITGLGAYVPPRLLANAELARTLGVSEAWIWERTGIERRHIAEPEQAAGDLAVRAARAALLDADAEPDSIDLVIVATASPDMFFPATATLVAAEIGAVDAAAYDLSAACTGFVYALAQAQAAVASGLARRALVIGAEVLSRFTNWEDRSTCILFGDGAGAAVVERVPGDGFLGFELGSDGTRASQLELPAGGSRTPASQTTVEAGLHTIRMAGQEVFRFSTRAVSASVERLLATCGMTIQDVDVFAPHQANRRIIDHIARRLGFPAERVLVNVDRVGNTSAASIPLVLAEGRRCGALVPGATVLLCAAGAGMTWGSALLRWAGERGA